MEEKSYSPKELAEVAGELGLFAKSGPNKGKPMTLRTIQWNIQSGHLRAHKASQAGNRMEYRIYESDIREFIKNQAEKKEKAPYSKPERVADYPLKMLDIERLCLVKNIPVEKALDELIQLLENR